MTTTSQGRVDTYDRLGEMLKSAFEESGLAGHLDDLAAARALAGDSGIRDEERGRRLRHLFDPIADLRLQLTEAIRAGRSKPHFWYGDVIRIGREASGLSVAEVGRRVGHAPSSVRRWEAGEAGRLDYQAWAALAQAVGLDPRSVIELADEVDPAARLLVVQGGLVETGVPA